MMGWRPEGAAAGGPEMSTATRVAIAELIEGEHLEQPEFHERYESMPPGVKAELIDGVVYMASPVGRPHGRSHSAVMYWLGHYETETPGAEVLDNTTAILGLRSEPQPDAMLLIRPAFGGQTVFDPGYIRGAPELVVEVAKSSRYIDLGPKLADYERAGVREYLVRAFDPDDVLWFRRVDGKLTRLAAGQDGLYRSEAFPGLWLDPSALLAGDLKRLRHVVEQGVATAEHAAFVARLAQNRAANP
jgi:Uma2 family endonuclease